MPELYTVKEAADILNINYRTMLKLIDNNTIHSLRIGREHRIPAHILDRFIHSADKRNVTYSTDRR